MSSVVAPNADPEELRARANVWRLTLGVVDSAVLKWAIELGLPSTLLKHGGPMTLTQIASSLPTPCTNLPILARLMRYLVHLNICRLVESDVSGDDELYAATPCTKYLDPGYQENQTDLLQLRMEKWILDTVCGLGLSLKGNETKPVFDKVHGESVWSFFGRQPERSKAFNAGMANQARAVAAAVVDGCRDLFMGLKSVVDVGGGTGAAMREISKAYPHLACTVLDVPHVIEGVKDNVSGVRYVGGDMFSCVPKADAVQLMSVLCDWGDEDCIKILKKCKEAIPAKGGKVIIVSKVLGLEGSMEDLERVKYAGDMVMMAITGGKERTKKEWKKLVSDAGFNQCSIIPLATLPSVIVASP
uniref:COMTL6 n=1 Tax=Piper methysticum TaxID=130404 RepID=A0A4Y5QNM0_9MAGN|nr:COMTL6 [Piper methysticum]